VSVVYLFYQLHYKSSSDHVNSIILPAQNSAAPQPAQDKSGADTSVVAAFLKSSPSSRSPPQLGQVPRNTRNHATSLSRSTPSNVSNSESHSPSETNAATLARSTASKDLSPAVRVIDPDSSRTAIPSSPSLTTIDSGSALNDEAKIRRRILSYLVDATPPVGAARVGEVVTRLCSNCISVYCLGNYN